MTGANVLIDGGFMAYSASGGVSAAPPDQPSGLNRTKIMGLTLLADVVGE